MDSAVFETPAAPDTVPFASFNPIAGQPSVLRQRITAAYRTPEPECLPRLVEAATLTSPIAAKARDTARALVEALRAKPRGQGVEGLIHEYSLSSQEGVALMCLAEALLRIPDAATRDALIRDKIATGDWRSHLGQSPSLFVNAATWGLMVTGKLTAATGEDGLGSVLTRLIARGGEPIIRKGVDLAMRMMGEQFVCGETIESALTKSRPKEAAGFSYSYDMLGEAATTAADAVRYYADYENAIHAIGKAAAGRGIYEGPGISIKLSALHPRYARTQISRVMAELLPRVASLAALARRYDIGLNVDAEEADRLELSLDILEALCHDPALKGWNGLGFVVQGYSKRCPFVIDYLVDLGRRTGHRLMVRLVKGAYWDSEIKRAQLDGLSGFPVFTRKIYTDISYIACAKKLLGAPDAVFPQFATHNAHTLATIMAMAGDDFAIGQYEFQCLHGMGEPLYEEVVGPAKLNRPCRVYAPVGTHETLLAYLVRRLLENGANSSFVNRIADADVPVADLIADPVDIARAITPLGAPHDKIALPAALFGEERPNSAGLDLSNESVLAGLDTALRGSAARAWSAAPWLADGEAAGACRAVLNPADHRDRVGHVVDATPDQVGAALSHATSGAASWAATPPAERAATLACAADLMQARMPELIGVLVREAGKSVANAVGEVREAIDFLRYYGGQASAILTPSHRPLGPIVCISPWNFPLAIFTGQIAAALAAGNPVVAKPAEETPLVAMAAVRLLREAGVPAAALQLLPGDGAIGAALVKDPATMGVLFTGSTEVARLIQRQLATRLTADSRPIPLVAETGGQNALIADSSALAEQVVADVIASAFDSAGQRCSALRILCLQDEAADRILAMLKGALAELVLGNPDRLATDIGPVITAEAQSNITGHVEAMRARGFKVHSTPLPPDARHGTFVPPTLIEIGSVTDVEREVFGPVLHVLRYRRDALGVLVDAINATGYGLTFGLHTRIDETVAAVTARIHAGNIYINRNVIGAVVGVQPFGGHGLSGTGPKAGGPLYLTRLVQPGRADGAHADATAAAPDLASRYCEWLASQGRDAEAESCRHDIRTSPLSRPTLLHGPVGEQNLYSRQGRGRIALLGRSESGLLRQFGAALATGNAVVIESGNPALPALTGLPAAIAAQIHEVGDWTQAGPLGGVLSEGDGAELLAITQRAAACEGPILLVQGVSREGLLAGRETYDLGLLVSEWSTSINTAAAGGNASLMSI